MRSVALLFVLAAAAPVRADVGIFAIPDTDGPFYGYVTNRSDDVQQITVRFFDADDVPLWGGHVCQDVPPGGDCGAVTTTGTVLSDGLELPETTSPARWFRVDALPGPVADLWVIVGNETRLLATWNATPAPAATP